GIRHYRLEKEGIQWPCPTLDHPGTKYLHKEKFSRGLGRFHPVDYIPAAELPDEEYPFLLTTGRILFHYHTGTLSRKVRALNEFVSSGYVEMNPKDVEKLGLKDGEKVKLISRRGSIEIHIKESERVVEGILFIPFHFAEAPANMLTNDALDPNAKIPEFKVCACKVEKIHEKIEV
ncbi:MAG: molybdopterin oxidoreductase family protein, partial [Dictyoglomaceae bacterium]